MEPALSQPVTPATITGPFPSIILFGSPGGADKSVTTVFPTLQMRKTNLTKVK